MPFTEKNEDNLPTIALVGRVNVGKSTLFNKMIEEKKAIVSNVPGTTRTTNEGTILWRGKQIRVLDTGGLSFSDDVPLEEDILKQSERAMRLADMVLFVVDGRAGLMSQERELAKRMRRIITKPVVVVVNKIDNARAEFSSLESEFYSLGLGEVFPVSAASGRRVGDLLDHIYHLLQKGSKRPKQFKNEEEKDIRVSLIGKPNVGKSSLFNKLIGEDKVIVSDMPHTTREPHDTLVWYENENKKQAITFVDTAGIRRKTKVSGELERAGISKSIEAIEKSDIILFVIDGSEPLSQQDMQLGGLIEKRAKSVILLVNKWDLSEDKSDSYRSDVNKMVMSYFPHLSFAPLVFVSGKSGYRVHDIFPLILQAAESRHTEVSDEEIAQFLKEATREHRPSRGKGTRHPNILGMRQIATNPPVFEMLIKYRTSLHRSYVHFIENKLREKFNFFASPIILRLAKMKR